MKKAFLLSAALAGMFTAYAQDAAQVDVKDAFTYNRSSLTVVPLVGLTEADAHVKNWADTVTFDGKFDMHHVKVNPIKIKNYRSHFTSSMPKMDESADAPVALQEAILKELYASNTPKAMLDYWLGFDGTEFNPAVWEARSVYNASDADVLKDRAAKVSTLANNGMAMMENTFVMVAGVSEFGESTNPQTGNKMAIAKSDAYVYKMLMSDEIKDFITNRYLIKPLRKDYKTEDAYKKDLEKYKQDLAAYANLKVELQPVGSVYKIDGPNGSYLASLAGMFTAIPQSGDAGAKALQASLNRVISPLEGKVAQWNVVNTVYSINPVSCKIGIKEGLKNSDRYGAYKIVENEWGELEYVFVGWLRATDIADNAFVADGETPCSSFYQISGMGLSEGMVLKQKNDLKMSVALSGMVDGLDPVMVDVDYLLHTTTHGAMAYAGFSLGAYSGDVKNQKATGTWINGTVNLTGSLHLTRWLELAVRAGVGTEYFNFAKDYVGSEGHDNDGPLDHFGFFLHGGARLGWQVWYPVQLFVRADYYTMNTSKIKDDMCYKLSAKPRFNQLGIGLGVKVNF